VIDATPLIDSLKPDWRLLLPTIRAEVRNYSREKFRADIVAALTVTLVSIPQILGFALVLGLPPTLVLSCAIVGAFVAALFFSSKIVIFGATNSVTLLVASAIHHGRPTALTPIELAVLLAALIGLMQIVAALLRIGQVTQFISRSVTIAYSSATGVLLVLTQLHSLFGLTRDRSKPMWFQLWTGVQKIALLEFDVSAPLVGGGALMLYILIRAVRPKWPDVLIGLTLITLAFWQVPALAELKVITLADQGALDSSLPGYAGVPFDREDLPVLGTILSTALAIALLGMIEAVALAKTYSIKHGEHIDSSREVMALGAGNLANAFFGTIPGSASFVRTAVNAQSGARTQFAGIAAAAFLLIALLLFSRFLNHIPIPALSASLVLIGLRMIDRRQIIIAARSTGSDALVLLVTFGAAMFFPLDNAIYIGIGLSLALALRKASTPTLVEYTFDSSDQLAQLGDKAARPHPQIAIIHVEGELFFGAADLFQEHVRQQVEREDLRVVILRLKSARHLDATTVFALHSLDDWLEKTGRFLLISGVQDGVLRVLKNSGLLKKLGTENVFPTESNPNLATKKALLRAQDLLKTTEADVRLYYDRPQPAPPAT
jgi:SulP family sulfate permease